MIPPKIRKNSAYGKILNPLPESTVRVQRYVVGFGRVDLSVESEVRVRAVPRLRPKEPSPMPLSFSFHLALERHVRDGASERVVRQTAMLGTQHQRWANAAQRFANERHSLIGNATARLLWHAYVLAACNLHVLLPGYPLPPLPTEEEFRELIG